MEKERLYTVEEVCCILGYNQGTKSRINDFRSYADYIHKTYNITFEELNNILNMSHEEFDKLDYRTRCIYGLTRRGYLEGIKCQRGKYMYTHRGVVFCLKRYFSKTDEEVEAAFKEALTGPVVPVDDLQTEYDKLTKEIAELEAKVKELRKKNAQRLKDPFIVQNKPLK